MSQFNTLLAFRRNAAVEIMEERPPQNDPITLGDPAITLPINVIARQAASVTDNVQQQSPHTGYLLAHTGPLHDIPTTQSLVAALQPTMTTTTVKPFVFIPGNR